MFRRLWVALLVAPLVVLAACGSGGSPEAAVPTIQSKAPSASPSSSEEPLPTTTPEAAKLQTARLGSSVAKTAEEKAVVEAWTAYWQAVYKTYGDANPAPGLDVARDSALTDVLDYLNEIKSKNHRIVGWTRLNVMRVKVIGNSATLRDCADDFSFEVDESNKPLSDVTPFYAVSGSLKKLDGTWIVTAAKSKKIEQSCKP